MDFLFDVIKLLCLCNRVAEGYQKFDLNVAYANRTVYLIWSQIWAVFIFHESLTVTNMIGLLVVFIGVLVVQKYE